MLHRTPRRLQALTGRYQSFLERLRGFVKDVTPEGAVFAGPTIGLRHNSSKAESIMSMEARIKRRRDREWK
jgi:hypothetical protein